MEFSTLNGYKVKDKKAIRFYDNVESMKNDLTLKNGMYVKTKGYSSINDGSGFEYFITDTQSETETQEELNNGLYATLISDNLIKNFNDFKNAINDDNKNSNYLSTNSSITVDETINLNTFNQCLNKCFTGGTFILNANMFSGNSLSYFEIPNFINCTFIGNGYSIVDDDSYSLMGRFVNCNFIDCSFIKNATFVQSARFVNCYIENNENTDFINTKRIYDTSFLGCQMEGPNKARLIYADTNTTGHFTISNVSLDGCVIEGQTKEIIVAKDISRMSINNLYSEGNTRSFIKLTGTNFTPLGWIQLSITNSRVETPVDVPFMDIDNAFASSNHTYFSITNSLIIGGHLSNFYDFKRYYTKQLKCSSGGKYTPANEVSRIVNFKNSIAEFTNDGQHCIVKKFPSIITFDTSDGGWHTNAYLVTLSYGNVNVTCLTDSSVTPTATYDSSTGKADVTLHYVSNAYTNRSGVLLTGIDNNLNPNDYWGVSDGYDV